MAGRRRRLDRRAGISVADRRLRRARARDGIRSGSANPAHGDHRGGASPGGADASRKRRAAAAVAPSPTDVATVPTTATRQGGTTTPDVATPGPSILVGAGGAVGLGVASSTVPLGRLFGAVEWSHLAVELAAEVSAPSTTRQIDGAGGFSQQQLLASLAGCGVLTPLRACLIAKVGEIRVVGQGVEFPATSYGLVAQAGLRLAVTHMLGSRLQIGAHADGLALITQGVVTLNSMPVWTTPRLAALFGAEIGIRFQ